MRAPGGDARRGGLRGVRGGGRGRGRGPAEVGAAGTPGQAAEQALDAVEAAGGVGEEGRHAGADAEGPAVLAEASAVEAGLLGAGRGGQQQRAEGADQRERGAAGEVPEGAQVRGAEAVGEVHGRDQSRLGRGPADVREVRGRGRGGGGAGARGCGGGARRGVRGGGAAAGAGGVGGGRGGGRARGAGRMGGLRVRAGARGGRRRGQARRGGLEGADDAAVQRDLGGEVGEVQEACARGPVSHSLRNGGAREGVGEDTHPLRPAAPPGRRPSSAPAAARRTTP